LRSKQGEGFFDSEETKAPAIALHKIKSLLLWQFAQNIDFAIVW